MSNILYIVATKLKTISKAKLSRDTAGWHLWGYATLLKCAISSLLTSTLTFAHKRFDKCYNGNTIFLLLHATGSREHLQQIGKPFSIRNESLICMWHLWHWKCSECQMQPIANIASPFTLSAIFLVVDFFQFIRKKIRHASLHICKQQRIHERFSTGEGNLLPMQEAIHFRKERENLLRLCHTYQVVFHRCPLWSTTPCSKLSVSRLQSFFVVRDIRTISLSRFKFTGYKSVLLIWNSKKKIFFYTILHNFESGNHNSLTFLDAHINARTSHIQFAIFAEKFALSARARAKKRPMKWNFLTRGFISSWCIVRWMIPLKFEIEKLKIVEKRCNR